jgi:hypothetical protein
MVKPVRRRRTFGGKEGIWWRKRTLPPIASETNESSSSSDPKPENINQLPKTSTITIEDTATTTTTTSTTTVGWDHDLCRPTFHRNMVSDECQDDSTSCEDEASSGDVVVKETTEQPKNEKAAPISIAPPAKRSRTFGCRSRRPLSLLLLDANCLEYSPSSPASSSPDKKKSCAEVSSPTSLLLPSPTDADTSTPSRSHIMIDDPELPRRVSTSPGGLVRSGEKPEHIEKTKSTPTSSTSSSKEDTASEPSPFDFEDEQQIVEVQRPASPPSKKDPKRPSASSSLLKAKEYFDNLDSTTKLTLDSYDSPVVSSRVVRTSRKVSLSSPGITREYKAYAEASTESGVSPLSRKDYARSRRDFFRNAELFDGFLDS